ncbi:gamma-glutamyltransferase [Ornithinimicrobium sp. Arc0846-15]|nr:gamma-glutamyltransferase [Ornithinimicrobium laminariae]
MVSSTHWLASSSAMRILELGGNAYDAGVAAGFVLQVVEPHLNGPGGDLPAIIAGPGRAPRVLCGQGPAPAGATPEHFADLGMSMVPGSGPLAAAVPGAVEAWMLLLRDYGTMTPRQVLEPALGYARDGHPLLGAVAATVERVSDLFATHWPTSAKAWLADGQGPDAGQLWRNEAWAATLERLIVASEAVDGSREEQIDGFRAEWSRGFVAQAIADFATRPFRHNGGEVAPGVITADDLASFAATWEEPATLEFAGHTIAKTGGWGQGPALLQVLGMLDSLSDQDPGVLDPDSAVGLHAINEAWKLAMADREAWLGDSAEVPLEALLGQDYLAQRAGLIGERADLGVRPGQPGGAAPRIAELALAEVEHSVDATVGEPTVRRDGATRGDTCHVDVVDRWGNMISATPSGGWLQSSPMIPELGFPLGSRLQMMWLEQGLVSSLVPGKRPRTTLTPTLVLRDGQPVLACGSPGGDQQDQWQSLFLLRHLAGGATLQEAIDAPMSHTTSFPGSFYPRGIEPGVVVAEDRIDGQVLADLEAQGHLLQLSGAWTLGRMCAVARDPHTGIISAGANPRGMQGYAVGR